MEEKGKLKDITAAKSVGDIMELRKQETRRRVTYTIVGVFCAASSFLIIWGTPDVRMSAMAGILGVTGPILGFYFGAKQTDH